jgi:6-phosphofructokinase
MVVEVMGRYAGWIALNAGISGTAHVILIPEIPYDLTKVADKILARDNLSRNYSIVVVAEGAKAKDGSTIVATKAEGGHAERLGGIGDAVARDLQELTGKDARSVVLGHLLRGGTPTTTDRLLSLRFGAAAVRALAEGASNIMVALDPPTVRYVPIEEVAGRMKLVPPDCDSILTARDLGISFGD